MSALHDDSNVARITVPMQPHGQQRHRSRAFIQNVRGTPKAQATQYDPKPNTIAKRKIQTAVNAALRARGPAWDCTGPMRVTITAFWKCLSPLKRSVRPAKWRAKKPDADNVAKAVLDACNGILWLDDNQVVDLRVLKIEDKQGRPSRVEITAERILQEEVAVATLDALIHARIV